VVHDAGVTRTQRRLTRIRAEGLFFLRSARALSGPFLGLVVVTIVGAIVHHGWGQFPGEPPPTWTESFFISYNLLFLEHIVMTPPHPAVQVVHYVEPLLGILLFSEGLLKLGFTVFKKEANAREWVAIMAKASKNHVVLCGLGNVGFRVLENLVAMDLQVFAIERDPNGQFVDRAKQLGAEVLIGDARTNELLASTNLQDARAVIVATDDDLANLEIALDVREMRSDIPVVMRLFDQRLAQKVRTTLGVTVSVSTSKVAAPLLAAAALDPSVVGTHQVGGRNLVVMELRVQEGSTLSKTPAALSADQKIAIVARKTPDSDAWLLPPPAGEVLETGDLVHVLVDANRVAEVRRWSEPA
jgi:voltage-gated potassium channel